jgi:hypothetical protein
MSITWKHKVSGRRLMILAKDNFIFPPVFHCIGLGYFIPHFIYLFIYFQVHDCMILFLFTFQ